MQPRRRSVLAMCLWLATAVGTAGGCGTKEDLAPASPWAQNPSAGSGGAGGTTGFVGGFGGQTDASPYQTRDAKSDGDVSVIGDGATTVDSSAEAAPVVEAGSAGSAGIDSNEGGDAPTVVDSGGDTRTEGGPQPACVRTESTETHCGDGIDNDCDGRVDCEDNDCKSTSVGTYQFSCDVPFATFGKKCDWLGHCLCPPYGATAETACNDGRDDDCDGKIDCEDEDCQPNGISAGNKCDALAHTCADAPTPGGSYCRLCAGGETHESTCWDGKDNDCDGKIDCADEDCVSVKCGPGSAQFCLSGTCVDASTAYVIKVTAARPSIPADGVATDMITVQLTNSQKGNIANQTITFTITGQGTWAGQEAGANTSIDVPTDVNGIAKATFLSDAAGGSGVVLASLASVNIGAQTTVTMPPLDDIKVASVENFLMGVKTSGYQEQNKIAFQLFAPNNEPYPEGLAVTFSHEPLGGSTIGPPPTPPCTVPGCTVSIPGATGGSGKATVTMYSGTIAGTRDVAIQATAGGQTKVLNTSAIAIVGAKASGSKITLTCNPQDVPALLDTDCIVSLNDEQITCTATLADRFNNVLGVSAIASFASEAGLVGPPVTTPKYPAADLGKAVNYINTKGGKIPVDVRPDPSLLEWSRAADPLDPGSCDFVEHNPRDGIVSVIAFAQGEEGFVDINGDGIYNDTEPFVDLGEPFVDSNDNNVQDPGEFFLDVNNNNKWDGPNGKWDSATTIWAETRIVYTGRAAFTRSGPPSPSYLSYGGAPLSGPVNLVSGKSEIIDVLFADKNYNVLAPITVFSAAASYGPVSVSILPSPVMRPCAAGGFFFRRLFCDADTVGADAGADSGLPSNCASACPPLASTTRCIVRSSLSSFEYGVRGLVQLKGGGEGSYSAYVRAVVNTKQDDLLVGGFVSPPPP
jgi:hypothetical protein